MIERLAILITGNPNSGKTTTLRFFCNTYDAKTVATFKQGLRPNFKPFPYKGIKVDAYFLPASRTERATPLADTFSNLGWCPDFFFMAEQLNGKEYANTLLTLVKNKYHIKEFIIDAKNQDIVWRPYNIKDEVLYQMHRTEQIADYTRAFINART